MIQTDFEREIEQLIRSREAERDRVQARLAQTEEDLARIESELTDLQNVRDLYRKEYNLPASPEGIDEELRERLQGMTVKQMMIIIARISDPPMFRVAELNQKLVKAGMYKDLPEAANSVYSTLGRNTKTFIKVARGQYMLNPATITDQPELELSVPPSNRRKSNVTGITDKVYAIRSEHPSWTEEQVVAELRGQGWDFRDKDPANAVRMALKNIGRRRNDNRRLKIAS